jgi:hypothetical protein
VDTEARPKNNERIRRCTMEGEKKRRGKFDHEFKIQAVKLLIEIV